MGKRRGGGRGRRKRGGSGKKDGGRRRRQEGGESSRLIFGLFSFEFVRFFVGFQRFPTPEPERAAKNTQNHPKINPKVENNI